MRVCLCVCLVQVMNHFMSNVATNSAQSLWWNISLWAAIKINKAAWFMGELQERSGRLLKRLQCITWAAETKESKCDGCVSPVWKGPLSFLFILMCLWGVWLWWSGPALVFVRNAAFSLPVVLLNCSTCCVLRCLSALGLRDRRRWNGPWPLFPSAFQKD